MSNFLDVCDPVQKQWTDGNVYNPQYNDWERSCLKALFPKIKEYTELHEDIRKLIEKPETQTETKTKITESLGSVSSQVSGQFSAGTTAGIGAAAGGAGIALGVSGVTLIPVLVKGIMKLFI